ncbi:MAG: hypothetical protein US98_C0053G0004 [Parcubacteria group bacterium GW2011_GWC1_38_6]|nr:MAG: hypothetical protein US98_C0053G0004 [Parcubacteria group bacterium GW2011_GWC1_38_6]
MSRKIFWEQRAKKEGLTYGKKPSLSAQLTLPFILKGYNVLTIGDAYGRNASLFAKHGVEVINVDLCREWIKDADRLKRNLPITNICEDIINSSFKNKSFEIVFANFVLHFFTERELKLLFKKLRKWLRDPALFICSWISEKDQYTHSGYPKSCYLKHYTEKDLKRLYKQNNFELVKLLQISEIETIFDKQRKTHFWFSVAKPMR